MALDHLAAPTVLPPPIGARVDRDLVYRTDDARVLHLDVYRPQRGGPFPVVFLVNGDAPEQVIAHAKDWGVYRSYGEHLAANGLAGVPFNHRSSDRGIRTAEVADDVRAAIAFVRERAERFAIDAARVGVWVFSAGGPFGLAPLLQRRPSWLHCAAGFYTIWDLEPFRADVPPPVDEHIRRWSCTSALDAERPDLPPLLLARAGKDGARILEGTATFIRRAGERDIDLVVLDHAAGQHGFDVRDDMDRSREIIRETLAFFARHLSGPAIRTEANGPYVVTGPVTIVDADGREHHVPPGHTVKLCRCGHSAKKPFCDQTHRRFDFVSRPAFLPEEQV